MEYVKADLEEKGHKVSNIINLTKSGISIPLPMFLIELEQSSNNKQIYNTSIVCNAIVKVEPPRANRNIPQCARCQRYGHTKNYCNKPPACVKCAGSHLSISCPLGKKIEKVICSNCKNKHPANYRGCIIRKELQNKLFSPIKA